MRERLFLFILFLGFGILLVKLFVLQVVQGAYWRELAEGNRIKVDKIRSLRGIIYDRNGKILVRNTPEGREYVFGSILSPVLGYIGEISQEELESLPQLGEGARDSAPSYQPGDIVGKIGIEKEYDWLLRGVDGGILYEVDANGAKKRQLGKKQPVNGNNLTLSTDVDLQKKIFEAMAEKKGAVVASDPRTGEILALVSFPTFDANVFTLQAQSSKLKAQSEVEKIINNKDQPLFNRAIAGLYPPGSTFKIVVALAGLSEKKITKDTQIEDTGQISVDRWTFGNWYFKQYGKTEGSLDIIRAIKRSNDIFFYKVGDWLGIEKLKAWANKLEVGRATGIDLPGEAEGLVPDRQWKKEVKNEDWYVGDNFNTAIGQGDVLVTPLQVNTLTEIVANEGKWCQPKIAQSSKLKAQSCRDLGIKKEYVDLVKEGMKEACATGGTGWPFFSFGIGSESTASASFKRIEVGCKTGTAEASGEKSNPHAWFTVFAPWEAPEIALTVFVENGGEGSSVAGPIAKNILKWWLEKKN